MMNHFSQYCYNFWTRFNHKNLNYCSGSHKKKSKDQIAEKCVATRLIFALFYSMMTIIIVLTIIDSISSTALWPILLIIVQNYNFFVSLSFSQVEKKKNYQKLRFFWWWQIKIIICIQNGLILWIFLRDFEVVHIMCIVKFSLDFKKMKD